MDMHKCRRKYQPALFTMIVTGVPPASSFALSTNSGSLSYSIISAGKLKATTPSVSTMSFIFAAVSLSGSSRRPTSTTLAPASAKPLAMAAPIPVPPPVIRAVLPVRSNSFVMISHRAELVCVRWLEMVGSCKLSQLERKVGGERREERVERERAERVDHERLS